MHNITRQGSNSFGKGGEVMSLAITEDMRISMTLEAMYDLGFKDGMAEAQKIMNTQKNIQKCAKELKEELDKIRSDNYAESNIN